MTSSWIRKKPPRQIWKIWCNLCSYLHLNFAKLHVDFKLDMNTIIYFKKYLRNVAISYNKTTCSFRRNDCQIVVQPDSEFQDLFNISKPVQNGRHFVDHFFISLQWRHNERNGVSNHQPHDCLLNRLFRHRAKKTSKLRVTGLYAGS